MKQKIIFIAGLGHSGSTILDLALGTHPEIIGLGEVYTLLHDAKRDHHYSSLCSCGKLATECKFWKNIPAILENPDSIENQYGKLICYFQDMFGEDKILVDSSKNTYQYLRFLKENHNLKVLFLVRDIRSWTYSRYLNSRKPLFYLAFRWYLENKKLLFRLGKMGIQYKLIGYEELSLYPEHLLKIISDYLEIGYDAAMLEPDKTNSHIISGNILRADALKRNRFVYDARWFLSYRMFLIAPFLSVLIRWNKKHVYSNISDHGLKEFYLFGTRRRKEMTQKFN